MKKYVLIAAAAIVRHEFEKEFRKLYRDTHNGKGTGMPFGMMLKKLSKAGHLDPSRPASLRRVYGILSDFIHLGRRKV